MMPAGTRTDPKVEMGSTTPHSSISVLLVDDEQAFRTATARRLALRGFTVTEAADGQQADGMVQEHPPDVVVCDLKMPNLDGLSLMRRRITSSPATAWIVLTGQASVDSAVTSLKLGAVEYLQKPIDVDRLELCIRQAYERHRPSRLMAQLDRCRGDGAARFGLVGISSHIRETCEFVARAAHSERSVLITGESGTGKELVARGIHKQSDRASRPFVTVNCAALSEGLLATELCGHVEGADGGAVGTKLGLFEVANCGSLFIDEIGDMSLPNQSIVLRVIETGQFRRLGDSRDRVVDVRIIAATVHDLPEMIRSHSFRADLCQRLSVLPWHLLPVRERPEDIPLLVHHFLHAHGQRSGQPKRLSPEAFVALQSYGWPGNVREIANVLERAAAGCDDYSIQAQDLELGLAAGVPTPHGMSHMLCDIEREHILRVLEAHGGNKLATAKALGISRMKLYRKLEHYGLAGVSEQPAAPHG